MNPNKFIEFVNNSFPEQSKIKCQILDIKCPQSIYDNCPLIKLKQKYKNPCGLEIQLDAKIG